MAIIEPEKRDVENPSVVKQYSAPLRLWHWINLLVIAGSLLTVLINSTLLDRQTSTALVQDQLQKAGASVTNEQARSVVHVLGDEVWQIHIYCGYTLVGLLLFRLGLEFFQVTDQKLIRKIKAAYRRYFVIRQNRKLAKHELLVKLLYAAFYTMLSVMAITGLCMAFEDDVPALKNLHFIRSIHSFTMYLILGFIVVHVAGVLLAECKESKGIVSDMINGGGE